VAKPPGRLTARYPSLLVRPCGLAESRLDGAVAWFCCSVLGGILLFEIVTPNDVVASLALIPLIAAMWALSTRMALRVGLVAAVVFGLTLATEAGNRPTVVFIAAVGLVLATASRFYASGLAGVWPAPRSRAVSLRVDGAVDSLTRRELEVASLASLGYTAAEIGARLHISDRTVESHLANAYTKLAIHSRSDLRELSRLPN
jgi:DNA-binding CsgD family transcriptional regulator